MKKILIIILLGILSANSFAQNTGCVSGNCDNGYGTWVYKSGAKYVGSFKNKQFNGEGTYYFANGDIYKGHFKNDKFYGYGVYTNKKTGDVYKGFWKDDKKNGEGTIVFGPNSKWAGEKYQGHWRNDMRDGWGTYYYKDGGKYTGGWKFDKLNGEGTYFAPDGSVEKAFWVDGKRYDPNSQKRGCVSGDCDNGYGTWIFNSGEKYTGYWKNKKRNGKGINYFVDGEWYKGEWKDDKREGYGINYEPNGDVYEGQWKNNARHGYGKLTHVDGTVKEGMWEYGRYVSSGKNNYGCISGDCSNGYGVYHWKSGERYAGYWKNNKREGKGTNYWPTGDKYKGNWANNMPDGYGKYTFANGVVQEGFFKAGKYVGKKTNRSGCVSGNCNNGYGTYVLANGDKYIGTFANGKYNGQGVYITAKGDRYSGDFSNGRYHGSGTLIYANNQGKYVGEFAYGKFDGKGSFYYPDGRIDAGLWKQGKFVGKPKSDFNPPEISWVQPNESFVTVKNPDIKIQLCVKTKDALEYVKVYNNDSLIINNPVRGYNVVDESCDENIVKNLLLHPGINKIKVVVKNIAGEAVSELKTFKYDAASGGYNKRLALVIGNSKYEIGALRNPVNDARSMAKKLQSIGFEVMLYTNLPYQEMKNKIREFGNKLDSQKGVGLFYYAGHGLQVNGENYLVPIDAHIRNYQDIEEQAINLGRVTGEMAYAKNDLNIIILDACRNNPFEGMAGQTGKGLAGTSAPSGTFIAYATAPGSVAADGSGKNGLYTQELLKVIDLRGKKIEDIFKMVRRSVYQLSNKKQTPWENSSIFDDFYFVRN